MNVYENEAILLTTMHRKEEVIAPIVAQWLKATITIADTIDTDQLGTFSGEVLRTSSPLETAIKKCQIGMTAYNTQYGLANEGSFGPHPIIPFLSCNYETVVFIDKQRGLIIHESIISSDTNFMRKTVFFDDPLEKLLQVCKFPDHALIVRPTNMEIKNIVFKGIQTLYDLDNAIKKCSQLSDDRKVIIETDMRAHKNPSRMKIIGQATTLLCKKILKQCPRCKMPGWGKQEAIRGLPCIHCNEPTHLKKYLLYKCSNSLCVFTKKRRSDITYAQAEDCPNCNP
jgi:hypothetical protein